MVGDVALLEPGEIVPCDGVFLSGHNVRCDESSVTGESDAIENVSYDDCIALKRKALELEGADGGDVHRPGIGHTDCFVVGGSKVLEGVGSYVVVAVDTKSFNGWIMMGLCSSVILELTIDIFAFFFFFSCSALRTDTENTPLQLKLNALAELIATLGSAAGLILFTALIIRFIVQLAQGEPARYCLTHFY